MGRAADTFGRVDVVVANAGTGRTSSFMPVYTCHNIYVTSIYRYVLPYLNDSFHNSHSFRIKRQIYAPFLKI